MILDRAMRSLIALDGAATSRVLNLCTVARKNANNEAYQKSPLFLSPVLNTAIFIKHRLRTDEAERFGVEKSVATKVVVPFDSTDLRAGGRSFFVREFGFQDALTQACQVRESLDLSRDITVLDMMDQLPSLDPFLLRERIRGEEFAVDDSYFSLSAADQERMFRYCSMEVSRLVAMAAGQRTEASMNASDAMIEALLSNRSDRRLNPLRAALGLNDHDFREGIFCWRGFLYYKWSLSRCAQQTDPFFHSMVQYRPRGAMSSDDKKYLAAARRAIVSTMREFQASIGQTIEIYDRAYAGMIEGRDPTAFREFLLGAPKLFVQLGEKMGVISHILSFWQYRCPASGRRSPPLDVEDFKTILQDFIAGLGISLQVFAA